MNGGKLQDVSGFPGTGRNDRPGRENNVIISFSLNQDQQFDDIMRIDAPYGYQFAENCFFGLEYRAMLGQTQPSTSNYLTLEASFSAVSKPNFESKYALELAICSKRRLRKGTWGETEK